LNNRGKTTFLTKAHSKFLFDLDEWLRDEQMEDWTRTVETVREMITSIETNGYYDEIQAEILNELRTQYIDGKLKK
jgi:predicted house-cleaning noncanonical NTP pyrophosphatase (MazG superfamily)